MTFENLAAWGRCLCAVCPTPTTIITSGTSTVVCVWELSMTKGRATGLRLKQVQSLNGGVGSGQVESLRQAQCLCMLQLPSAESSASLGS